MSNDNPRDHIVKSSEKYMKIGRMLQDKEILGKMNCGLYFVTEDQDKRGNCPT